MQDENCVAENVKICFLCYIKKVSFCICVPTAAFERVYVLEWKFSLYVYAHHFSREKHQACTYLISV